MGYYTSYTLVEVLSTVTNKKEDFDLYEEEINEEYDVYLGEDTKWYDFDDDMKKYSKQHPDLLFTFHTVGEEHDDSAMRYFKNGKYFIAEAEITYEPYDESKLK